jgi:hypothetical protein
MQTVVLLLDLCCQPSCLSQGGEVGNVKMQTTAPGYASHILPHVKAFLPISAVQEHRGTLTSQLQSRGLAYSIRGPGDQNNPAIHQRILRHTIISARILGRELNRPLTVLLPDLAKALPFPEPTIPISMLSLPKSLDHVSIVQ